MDVGANASAFPGDVRLHQGLRRAGAARGDDQRGDGQQVGQHQVQLVGQATRVCLLQAQFRLCVHDRDAEATYYYLTYDTKLADLKQTAANFDDIEALLQGIGPRKKLFLMEMLI